MNPFRPEEVERAERARRVDAELAETKLRALDRAKTAGLERSGSASPSVRDLSRDELRSSLGQEMGTQQKGEIGERAMVIQEAKQGRIMIAAHPENTNQHGFDGVSWDSETRTLHLLEAKNYGATVSAGDLSAMSDQSWPKNIDATREAIRNSDLGKGDKIAARAALRQGNYEIDLYVPKGIGCSDSAKELLMARGNTVVSSFDGRILWSQERMVVGRSLS
jgi:hypothetical protein